jgi:hypothetical protein
MKRLFLKLLGLIAVGVPLHAQTSPLYLNTGIVADEFPIDARVFDNRGYMSLTPIVAPYDTQGTEFYYNSGLIIAQPGIRFGYIGADGTRRASQVFSNSVSGRIESVDSLLRARSALNEFLFNRRPPGLQTADERDVFFAGIRSIYRSLPDSYMSIWADTIHNRGALFGSSGGELTIRGRNVDLSRSVVGINPPPDQAEVDPSPDGGFDPIPGTTEVHWAYGEAGFSYGGGEALLRVIPRTQVVLGVTNSFTNVAASAIYLAGTATRPLVTDGTATTGGERQNLNWPFNISAGGTNILYRNVIPFFWNGATPGPDTATAEQPSTNQTFTIVMVRRATTNLLVDASVQGGGAPGSLPTVNLRLTGVSSNNITGRDDAVSLVIRNTFGSDPQVIYLTNRDTGLGSRPTNLSISRVTRQGVPNPFSPANTISPDAFNLGLSNFFTSLGALPGGAGSLISTNPLRTNILTAWVGPGATNPVPYQVNGGTNPYMAYRIELGVVPGRLPISPSVPDISPTNGLGRLVIDADTLNLERTRIRGQGPVILHARDLVSLANASIDAPFITANLTSKSGSLNMSGVFQASVQRLSGNVTIFSTSFTNNAEVTVPAPPPANPEDPPGEDVVVPLEAVFHVMLVDASLTTEFPTPVLDMSLTSTNLVIGDFLTVSRFARLNVENLTVNGRLEVRGNDGTQRGDFGLGVGNAPLLKFLTNNGAILVSNNIALGTDRPTPMEAVVNNGSLRSATLGIRTKDLVFGNDAFVQAASGPISIEADRATIRAGGRVVGSLINIPINSEVAPVILLGNVQSYGQLSVTAGDLLLGGGTVLAAPSVDLGVRDSFVVEAEGAAVNTAYRFSLASMPPVVNLNNLRVSLAAQPFQEVEFYWPGTDKGPSTTAFDGASIASLELDGGRFSGFRFIGTGARNALYVRSLNLTTNVVATNGAAVVFLADLSFSPGMTIYFSTANVDAAGLELATGGRFKQVDFSGAGLAPMVAVPGRTGLVPRGLRYSTTIDSDGDGIVNAFDADPFEGVVQSAQVVDDGSRGFRVTWEAAPWQSYTVQYTSDLSGGWQRLQQVTNPTGANQTLWIRDPIPEGPSMRAYRVLLDD